MGGRGNNRNSFYKSTNKGGRNTAYDNRSQAMSQSPHTSQPANNYSFGIGNGNFQPRPFWQNSFPNGVGFPRVPSWGPQNPNNNPPWGRNNYRPNHQVPWDHTQQHQQHRFPNQQNSMNFGAPALAPPPPPPPPLCTPNSTFRFSHVPLGVPPPMHPPTSFILNSSSSTEPTTQKTASKECTSSSVVINPPLGSKEDRELRLEEAKTLVKKSLEESKGGEFSRIAPPTNSSSTSHSSGQNRKKCLKPKPTKPNEGINCKQISCLPVDQVSDSKSSKTSSAVPLSDEQRKRRLSLESNCVLSSDASKSTSKPATPKRNRSNSLSVRPKTPEISAPSEAQNIKQRIIHELLGMSKNTLKEIISNPRSRKFEHVMKYMMKESRWKQSQIQRQVARAGIDSTSENQNCELVQRDYEDLLLDPDLAINLSNLPSEMIETLGNIFNLGVVSRSEEPNLDSEDISCLFDSNSPSYIKEIPYVDLSSPVSIYPDPNSSPEDKKTLKKCNQLTLVDSTNLPACSDHDLDYDEISNILVMESMGTEESSHQHKTLEPSRDLNVNRITTFSALVDGPVKHIPSNDVIPDESNSAEDVVLQLSRPEIDNFPVSVSQEGKESIEDTTANDLNVSKSPLNSQNGPFEENDCAPSSALASDVYNEADKCNKLQTLSAVDEATPSNKDPMFSTQSDSPTNDEELMCSSSRTKKDSENNLDSEDRDNNQLETDEPLLSPDAFNVVNINNNEMMAMTAINTVEPEESVVFFGASERAADQCNHACPANSDEQEQTSSTQDFKCGPVKKSLDVDFEQNFSNNGPTVIAGGSMQSKSIIQKNQIEELESTKNHLVGACTENPTVLEIQRVENTPLKFQELSFSSKTLSGIEIGIQTDASLDDTCLIDGNDMASIVKLLDSSCLPGIDHVKKLLSHLPSKPSVFTDENFLSASGKSEHLKKGISKAADDMDASQCSLFTRPSPDEETPLAIPLVIDEPPMVKPTLGVTNRHSKSKRQPCADFNSSATTAGTLKNLQNQIKGLEPKDKLKYVFLKITDIEKKIAEWADIKKELYQLVSYILEDEKSQSASSSHEESISSEIEPESNKNSKRLSAKKNSCPSQLRLSRSNVSSMPAPVEPNSECESSSNSPSKNAPKRKRRRVAPTYHVKKKKTSVRNKTSNQVLIDKKNELVPARNISLRSTRSLAKIKIESSSDNEDSLAICSPIGERSRSSKRNKPLVRALDDSSPPSSPAKKRTCTRQSVSNNDALSTQTCPLRKTKAELKQMVFFPKTPEKSTRQAPALESLNDDVELRVTRRGRSIVVKEEIPRCETELNEIEPVPLSCSLPLRDCSVVLQQLDQSKLQPMQIVTADESTMDSQSVTSSDEDDELPLSTLSRKPNISSPTASLQEDIDISSISSSDTVSLKLYKACPKSIKYKMKKCREQAEGSHHHHRHSSRHGPLVFAQHTQGTIMDIKVVGKHVLAAAEDGVVLSYSVKSGKLKKKYRGHSAAVTCICVINSESEPFYPEKMVTGSADGQVRYFILKTGEQIHAPLQVGETTAIDSDWGVIYLGTKKGEIVQVNTKTFTSIGEIFQCSQEPIHALKATKEGPRKVLIVGSRNQAITVRDAETGLLLRSVSGGWQSTVYSLILDKSLVYCGTKEGTVPAFDFTNGQQMFSLQAGNGVRCLKSYNGLLFAGCYDGFIYVFKGQTLVTKFAGGKMIISMDFTKNKVIFSSKDMLQALHFPQEVSLLLKEMKMKKVK